MLFSKALVHAVSMILEVSDMMKKGRMLVKFLLYWFTYHIFSLSPGMAVGTRMGTFFLPYNFFTEMFTMAAPFLGDYKRHNAERIFE
jgi:hypothetical protein